MSSDLDRTYTWCEVHQVLNYGWQATCCVGDDALLGDWTWHELDADTIGTGGWYEVSEIDEDGFETLRWEQANALENGTVASWHDGCARRDWIATLTGEGRTVLVAALRTDPHLPFETAQTLVAAVTAPAGT